MGLLGRFELIPKLNCLQICNHLLAFIQYLLPILDNLGHLALLDLLHVILDPFPSIHQQPLALLQLLPDLFILLDLLRRLPLALLLPLLPLPLQISDVEVLLFEPFYYSLELRAFVDRCVVVVLRPKQITVHLQQF